MRVTRVKCGPGRPRFRRCPSSLLGTRANFPRGSGVASRYNRAMQCPQCKSENSGSAQFCTRCHATLRFICPACRHSQDDHGGACEQCGVDFAKYAAMLIVKEQVEAENQHTRVRNRVTLYKQAFLIPITGGLSLLKYLFTRTRNT
jgi:hypothetical protein